MSETTPQELERKFWKALKSDRTLMLGLDGVEDGHSRPMTAQVEGESGPIWFFTGKPNALVRTSRAGPSRDRKLHCQGPRVVREHQRQLARR